MIISSLLMATPQQDPLQATDIMQGCVLHYLLYINGVCFIEFKFILVAVLKCTRSYWERQSLDVKCPPPPCRAWGSDCGVAGCSGKFPSLPQGNDVV